MIPGCGVSPGTTGGIAELPVGVEPSQQAAGGGIPRNGSEPGHQDRCLPDHPVQMPILGVSGFDPPGAPLPDDAAEGYFWFLQVRLLSRSSERGTLDALLSGNPTRRL